MNFIKIEIVRRLLFTVGLLVLSAAFASAQTLEKCAPSSSDNKYTFDISLPLPDPVKSIDISANGNALGDRANVDLHAIQDMDTTYVCDVLLVVDKSAGGSAAAAQAATPAFQSFLYKLAGSAMGTDNIRQMTRFEEERQQNKNAQETGPIPQLYRVEVTTLDGAAYETLASFGSNEGKLEAAIHTVQLNGGTQRVARGLSNLVSDLTAEGGNRKFIVFLSTGRFDDAAGDFEAVTKAAKDAGIKICPVDFNEGHGEEGFNSLAGMADATQGFTITSDRENAQGEFPIASEKVEDLLAYMTSGARGTFSLPGVTFPAAVHFAVTTEYGKVYSVDGKLDTSASPATPTPATTTAPAGTNAPSASPSGTNAPGAHPPSTNTVVTPVHPSAPAITTSAGLLDWVEANPDMAGGIVLGALVLVGLLIFLASRRSVPEASVTLPEESPAPVAHEVEPAFTPAQVDEPVLAWLIEGDQRHPLGTKPVRIGRKSDNDIVLHDESVSQYHAEVVRRDNGYLILDRGSSNKVLIAGRAVSREVLRDGDVIELGERRLRFELNS